MDGEEILGDSDVYIAGDYPASLPHLALEEQDDVHVRQEYVNHRGRERENIGYMSGEEASEWLREFEVEDMLSYDVLESDRGVLGWNPARPDGFRDGLDSYSIYQEDGSGSTTVKVSDRTPWPVKQSEKVIFNW